MAKDFKIAVLASTRGTDLQAIIEAIESGDLKANLCCVISNVEDCGALEKARKAGIDAVFVDANGLKREEYDRKISETLEKYGVKLIVLVGYMRILSPWFVKKYDRKIINIHPSLLPDFPGMDLNVHEEVLKSGKTQSGMTIHYVDETVDGGEIILQKKVDIAENETVNSLKEKVQNLEKIWYPRVIEQIRKEKS